MLNKATLEQALELARKRQVADADVVMARTVHLNIEVAKSEVETLEMAETIGLGVRLITEDGRMGFSCTTALQDVAALDQVVEMAWQNAQPIAPDVHNVLPSENKISKDDWSKEDLAATPVEKKIEFCRLLEEKALGGDPRITMVDRASYSDYRSEIAIINTRGLFRQFSDSGCSCSASAIAAQDGMDSEFGSEFDVAKRFEDLRLEWVADRCVQLAVNALGGKPCKSGTVPIVLDNGVVAQFLSTIGSTLMADRVLKGKSMFAKDVGKQIASPAITIIDQNDLDKGLNRAPFDAEGTSAHKTVLVKDGVLRGFLHNTYTAHKMGEKSTGNAGRYGEFQSVPEVVATNCYIEPGNCDKAKLFDKAGNALFITEVLGMHTVNPISGDFSVGASGRQIEEGRLGRPVRGITLAGNIRDFLNSIIMAADDLRFFGAYGAPSLLVSQMAVSGE